MKNFGKLMVRSQICCVQPKTALIGLFSFALGYKKIESCVITDPIKISTVYQFSKGEPS